MKYFRSSWITIATILFATACRQPVTTLAGASVQECFAVERLSRNDRQLAEQVLLEFADREGLYTLAGGLKPISSDVRNLTFRIAPMPDTIKLAELEQLRRVASVLRCGDIGMFVQVFTATSTGRDSSIQRHATLVLYHRASVLRSVGRQWQFFATIGITPSADPRDVVNAVENAPRDTRWRGYGYLFGYPDEAVDFFVRAGVEGDSMKKLVPRDFRRIETWYKYPEFTGGPRTVSSFVYAVQKDAPDTRGDRTLRAAAAPIYQRYVEAREKFVHADSTSVVSLWRSWISGR